MREELKKLSEDIKKVQKAESILSTIATLSIDSEMEKLINYALDRNIIKGTMDVVDLCADNPEAQKTITKAYDKYMKEKTEREKESYNYSRRYAGTYDSLSEVPGYGTEWNSRCIPDGVIIRGANKRC